MIQEKIYSVEHLKMCLFELASEWLIHLHLKYYIKQKRLLPIFARFELTVFIWFWTSLETLERYPNTVFEMLFMEPVNVISEAKSPLLKVLLLATFEICV